MRVKAKLSRVSYDDRGKPIVNFLIDQCYNAFEGLNGNFTVSDKRGNPTKFTRDEFDRFFKVIEVPEFKPRTLYVIDLIDCVKDTPAADVVEVVRCKDCVYCCISTDPKTNISIQKCGYVGFNPIQSSQVSDDFYCSHGVRKD